MTNTATRAALSRFIYRTAEPGNPLSALQQALDLAEQAEPLEKKLRVEGLKTGRVTALDLPAQIEQARALGHPYRRRRRSCWPITTGASWTSSMSMILRRTSSVSPAAEQFTRPLIQACVSMCVRSRQTAS